ncbi:MAG: C10 family peptidase [Bacteroidales bacterium]|nr:C10 family peptidase [Bacteroidales bacterium]
MKRTIVLWVLMATLGVCAKPVPPEMAASIAQRYFSEVENITPAAWSEVYVFSPAEGNGFVIVSADDCTMPVLAYSLTQSFDTLAMPAHVSTWLGGYRSEVASLREAEAVASKDVAALWMPVKGAAKGTTVGPLLTTQWSQGGHYNSRCPVWPGTSSRVVTGCVATAMAQVMKYWNHPIIGHGNHTYTASGIGTLSVDFDTAYWWEQMPDKLNGSTSATQNASVAQLMYHVGVSVSMNYGVRSSGAQVAMSGPSAATALKAYFRYSPALRGVYRTDYTKESWQALMKSEIDHRRPVLYAGYDNSGGHAFVLDGYNQVGDLCYFHINWGWAGAYDGYFALDALAPGGGGTGGNATYTFNLSNEAVVGIEPSGESRGLDVSVVDVQVADSRQGSVSGSGRYATYKDQVTLQAEAATGYRFDHWRSGVNSNPHIFTVNGDYADTAFFLPTGMDTIGYSCDIRHSAVGNIAEWGIRIPAHLRQQQRSLRAIRLYLYAGGDYTLRVYRGDTANASTLVYSQAFFEPSRMDWVTVELDSAVYVDNYQPLWLTLSYRGGGTPAVRTAYGGNADGSWCRSGQKWKQYTSGKYRYTWMLRGIFAEREPQSFSVATATAMADSSAVPVGCIASGDGLYAEDSVAVLQASADSDHVFLYWLSSQGDTIRSNPYRYHPTANVRYTAVFQQQQLGIRTLEAAKPTIEVRGHTLRVKANRQVPIAVVDCIGRTVAATPKADALTAETAAAGIYIVVVDGHPYKVIVH